MNSQSQPAPWLVVCGSAGVGRSTLAARLLAAGADEPLILGPVAQEAEIDVLLRAGANARAALVLVDLERGIDAEARRLSHLVSLLGIQPLILLVNRADTDPEGLGFARVAEEWGELAERIGLLESVCLPISALRGENVSATDPKPPWFDGPSLLGYLAAHSGRERDREPGAPLQAADQLQATIVWGHDDPLLRGRSYGLRIGEDAVTATVAPLKYRINLDTFVHTAASKLERGEVGVAALELSRPIRFLPYAKSPLAGSFRLIDPRSDETVGVGLIQFALRRSQNLRWQAVSVNRTAREKALGQRPRVVWLTGLSGAGKSTIANLVESELYRHGRHTYLLDGDNVRHGLNRDLGFTDADRVENIRRVAEVAKLMLDAGLIVLVSFISPFRSERLMARSLFAEGEFLEVYVDTPLAVAEERDPKGLYAKARRGELRNFTGIDSPYEPPERPELTIDTTATTPAQAAAALLGLLER